MKRVVYIAGRFSGSTRDDVEANIMAAVRVALDVARAGAMPLTPHANTAHPEFEKVQSYAFWIDGTMELLRRSDAVMLVHNWRDSSGARGEVEEAHAWALPVFDSLEQLRKWLAGEPAMDVRGLFVGDGL